MPERGTTSLSGQLLEHVGKSVVSLYRRAFHHWLEFDLELYHLKLQFQRGMSILWNDARLLTETGLYLQEREAVEERLKPVKHRLLETPRDHVEMALDYAKSKMAGRGESNASLTVAHFTDVAVADQTFHIYAMRFEASTVIKDPQPRQNNDSEEILYFIGGEDVMLHTGRSKGNKVEQYKPRVVSTGDIELIYKGQMYLMEYGGKTPLELLIATPDKSILAKE